eukprot:g18285.t1
MDNGNSRYPYCPANPSDPNGRPYPRCPHLWFPDPPSESCSGALEHWRSPSVASSSSSSRVRTRSHPRGPPSPKPRGAAPLCDSSFASPDAISRRCLSPDPSPALDLGLGPRSGPGGALSPAPQGHCASCGRLQTGDFTRPRFPGPRPLSRDDYPPSAQLVVGFGLVGANTTSSSSSSPQPRLLHRAWAPTPAPPLPPTPPPHNPRHGTRGHPPVNERQLTGRVVYDARLHRALRPRGG